VYGIGEGFRAEPWWCRALVMGAARTARRGGVLRLAVSAAQLTRSGPRQAVLDAVDLALFHGAAGTTYRWEPFPAVRAA
jgi:predicted deacetylase